MHTLTVGTQTGTWCWCDLCEVFCVECDKCKTLSCSGHSEECCHELSLEADKLCLNPPGVVREEVRTIYDPPLETRVNEG